MVSVDYSILLINVYLSFQILRKRDIDKIIYLFSIFTKKQYFRPLLVNICLISIQQFSGNISLMHKLQCTYGVLVFPLSGMVSTMTSILVIQVLTPCYCSLSFII